MKVNRYQMDTIPGRVILGMVRGRNPKPLDRLYEQIGGRKSEDPSNPPLVIDCGNNVLNFRAPVKQGIEGNVAGPSQGNPDFINFNNRLHQ